MPFPPPSQTGLDFERDIYSVSRLNAEVRSVLEGSFPLLWVEGELSNLATPSSGHIYFSLKDGHAQVRCAMFRMRRIHLRFRPENGMQVLARARVGLYEGRGEYQLLVEHMEPGGEGALRQAFERLKGKLAAEGLFDAERKRALPAFPRRIGVVTSPTGAAIRDVLSVLRRRMPALPVILYPVQVQGEAAPAQLVRALQVAGRRNECDVLLLVRGGGSLEDLVAFNDEAVARTVAASPIPVVCGVGHEIDFSIADFVADRRAATPSAAAELVSPDRRELYQRQAGLWRRLLLAQRHRVERPLTLVKTLNRRLQLVRPASRLAQGQQRLDELELRLRAVLHARLERSDAHLRTLRARLGGMTPEHRIRHRRLLLQEKRRRLPRAMQGRLGSYRERLSGALRTLDAVSPLATLSRGYAIVSVWPEGSILRDAAAVSVEDRLRVRLAEGELACRVEEVRAGTGKSR